VPNVSFVRDRQPQMRDARFEIILETGDSARHAFGVIEKK
jgi:hypothetical protein